MTGRREHGPLPWMGWFLLLAALFTGLLAMHGAQSTPSPSSDGPGLPGLHLSHDVPMPDIMPAVVVPDADVVRDTLLAHAIAPPGDPADAPMHHHPGGQVCLGLFVATWLFLLLAAALPRRRDGRGGVRPVRTRSRAAVRQRPPSIFQLSVLRL